jgi:transcriptional regulator with GAF, ATPase, and Fis domain
VGTEPFTAEIKGILDRAREAEERDRRLREIAHRMFDAGQDVRLLARAALEGLLALFEFERGFLLLAHAGAAGEEKGEPRPFQVMEARAARHRGTAGEEPQFEGVQNPEFAINRSAAKRAFQARQGFVIQNCLVEPLSSGEEVHRSVLCQPFAMSPGTPAVIYLDRGLRSEPIPDRTLAEVGEFAERCLPILAQGILGREVIDLRAAVEEARSRAGDEAEDDEGPGPAIEEASEPTLELPAEIPCFHGIVGKSEKMRRLFQIIEKVKDSDLNMCIFGESGTGKELVANAIHRASRRGDKKFISETCGTLSETLLESELFGHLKGSFTGADDDRQGLFEAANGGTLFFDEIGDMSEGMQRKLLRVLQEGMIRPIGSKQAFKVDVRVICASNKNLRALVQSGAFRVDLFYRVNVVSIEVPPLRDRVEDIPLLVAHFLAEIKAEDGVPRKIAESAMNAFLKYNWPGNVRELKNVIKRAVVTSPHRTLVRKDVVPLLSGGQSSGYLGEDLDRSETQIVLRLPRRNTFSEIIDECERVVLLNALKECHWNKSKVVKLLKIPRQSLYNKIEKHDLRRKWE